eukprot:GILI01035958.1.p1 GENE.GILI01035958.1~~GILI01035958.1.p1  ORF type:complete len:243 (+),score=21.85 GILI01035958.1:60-788(+)
MEREDKRSLSEYDDEEFRHRQRKISDNEYQALILGSRETPVSSCPLFLPRLFSSESIYGNPKVGMDACLGPLLPPLHQWDYDSKRQAQEIVPRVFLGPFSVAKDAEFLAREGITHILIVRGPEESKFVKPKFESNFVYSIVEFRDRVWENIMPLFPVIRDFIIGALQAQGKVLVHGNAGLSRSAVLVIAFVMEVYNMDHETAYNYVLCRRNCISLNDGFRRQLREYELIFKTIQQLRAEGRL